MKHAVTHRLGVVDDKTDTRAAFVTRTRTTARALHRHALRYAEALCAVHTIEPTETELLAEARLTVLALETQLETVAREHAYAVDALAVLQRVQTTVPRSDR